MKRGVHAKAEGGLIILTFSTRIKRHMNLCMELLEYAEMRVTNKKDRKRIRKILNLL